MFIINLSCADIGVAVLCMPFSLVTCLRHGWVLGDALCKLSGFVNILFCLTSLLTLTAISVEKYFAICKPLYHRYLSRKFALGLLLWTWILPNIIACVPFFGIAQYEFKPGIFSCVLITVSTTQCGVRFPPILLKKCTATFVILCGFVIPLSIMEFTYSNIFRSARRHARRVSRVSFSSTCSTNSTTAHRQVAVTVLILFVVFLLCWLPYFLYVVLVSVASASLSADRRVIALGKAAYWCEFASSALNPYIYGFRNPHFREEFQFLLCWLYAMT
ncbi:melatonin receptor type 1B-like [Orbicella faveolata]|uniref:melatonin receptor type 1B-like n=1 Tax=Orbicella faveolata TaxID=48498 RepID=UPI0009E2C7DA|nr:melatonin receptor type 1B-like [Orbicella faveolata]